jgi:hypothetical protein
MVGAEAFSFTEIAELSRCGQSAGRDLVDVDVDLPVDWPKSVCRCRTAAQLRSGAIPRGSGNVDERVSDDPETFDCAH